MLLKLFILSYLSFIATSDICRALALEGGGSHGAYEAGVIYALANSTASGNIQ